MFGELAHRLPSILRMGSGLVVPSTLNSGLLYSSTAIGTVATSQTSSALLVGTGKGSLTLPPNFFIAGTSIGIEAYGYYTSTTTGTATLTSTLSLGGTAVATLNGSTGVQMPGSLTGAPMYLVCMITCRAPGISGVASFMAGGLWSFAVTTTIATPIAAGNAVASIQVQNGNTGAAPSAVTTGIDTGTALAIGLSATTGSTLTLSFNNFNVYQLY